MIHPGPARFSSAPVFFLSTALLLICTAISPKPVCAGLSGYPEDSALLVKHCNDFEITGAGSDAEWNRAAWHSLTKIDHFGPDYSGRIKMLYSSSGIYVLFNGEDRRITTSALEDMSEVYEGDAFEVFFFPDTARGVYFEYEINALGKQLVLALAKSGNKRSAWLPWSKSPGQINRKVAVAGGDMQPNASISGWTAELFFSYEVLNLVCGQPPKAGDEWRANLCRLDYDNGRPPVKWSWSPGITNSFHELAQFRRLKFD